MTAGGKRRHAGRPKAAYGATTTLRVPKGCVPEIKGIVKKYKKQMLNKKTT